MSKIVSIHSYRGGTGKSNTTANLAAAVAKHGYRVGIVDTDIQSPGIHVLFGFDEDSIQLTLNDFLWGNCAIAEAAYDVTRALNGAGTPETMLYLVPSSIRLNDISRILREQYDVELLHEGFLDLIKSLKLDYLFVDTHPGLNEETLLSLSLSDIVMVVLRRDRQDLQGTAVTVDVARRLQVSQLFLLLNRVLPDYDFAQLSQKIESLYDTPVAGILPESEEMIRLGSEGIFCVSFPEHPVSKVYEEIAERITAPE